MRILMIHNRYLLRGGEDSSFEAELDNLTRFGHDVLPLIFSNSSIERGRTKILFALRSLFNIRSFWVVRKTIKDFKPDIIHIHNLFSDASPSVIWAAKSMRVPTVMTLHNYRLLCPSGTLRHAGMPFESSLNTTFPWKAIWRGVYRESPIQTLALSLVISLHRMLGTWNCIDRFFVLSQAQLEIFAQSQLKRLTGKFVIKPNFCTRSVAATIPEDAIKRRFIYLGRLSDEKGIHTLLDAFKGTHHQLQIFGEGPLHGLVTEFCISHKNVSFAPSIPKENVAKEIQSSCAVIFPSLCPETFGMVAIEALASGRPLIGSRIGAIKEIIEDGTDGLLFEPGDSFQLKSCLDAIAADTSMYHTFCENALRKWMTLYSPEVNIQITISQYKEVLRSTRDVSTAL